MQAEPRARLEHLRAELRAERISWGELHELQSLADHIAPGDVELLEAAGVPEFDPDRSHDHGCAVHGSSAAECTCTKAGELEALNLEDSEIDRMNIAGSRQEQEPRSDTTLTGDDTAGTVDHNRRA